MRAAHSLKGAARVVGLDAAVRVAHAMEDCLVAAQKGQVALGPGGIDALLRGVDLLTQVSGVSEGEIGAWQESHAGEVEALVADLAAVQAGKGPAVAASRPGVLVAPDRSPGLPRHRLPMFRPRPVPSRRLRRRPPRRRARGPPRCRPRQAPVPAPRSRPTASCG